MEWRILKIVEHWLKLDENSTRTYRKHYREHVKFKIDERWIENHRYQFLSRDTKIRNDRTSISIYQLDVFDGEKNHDDSLSLGIDSSKKDLERLITWFKGITTR